MDKTLAEYLFPEIEKDQFLISQFQKLLIDLNASFMPSLISFFILASPIISCIIGLPCAFLRNLK